MGMIGSLAGSAISIGGGLLGAKALNKGYRQQQEIFNNRMNDIKAHRTRYITRIRLRVPRTRQPLPTLSR